METIRLKNGTEEVESLVVVTMLSLEHLMDERPLALYDLVMMCRDSSYEPFGDNGDHLKDLRLIDQDGSVHSSVRNIILSATDGNGMDMVLQSPVDKK